MRDPPVRADVAAKSTPFILTVELTVMTGGAHMSFFFFLSLSLFPELSIPSHHGHATLTSVAAAKPTSSHHGHACHRHAQTQSSPSPTPTLAQVSSDAQLVDHGNMGDAGENFIVLLLPRPRYRGCRSRAAVARSSGKQQWQRAAAASSSIGKRAAAAVASSGKEQQWQAVAGRS